MEDLIKREDAIKVLAEVLYEEPPYLNSAEKRMAFARNVLKDIPSAENKGEWIFVGNSIEPMWECSECGEKEFGSKSDLTNFCPNCGIKMKGASDV